MKRIFIALLLFVFVTNCKTIEQSSTRKYRSNEDTQSEPVIVEDIVFFDVDLSFVPEIFRDFVPEVRIPRYFLDYNGFALEFDMFAKNAKWVSYLLCKANLGSGEERPSNFRMERRLGELSPRDAAYRNSGYDRGHLAPAADMAYSTESMYDSFFLTNVSPQDPGFNRGIWKRLEEQIRKFALEKDSIYVVTGPVLYRSLPRLGNSSILIPEYFYKVILKKDINNHQGIAFIMKNESSSGDLKAYTVSIDSVEVLTGINFFPLLTPLQELKAEATFDLSFWFGN